MLEVRKRADEIQSLLVSTEAGKFVFASAAVADLLGYQAEQLIDMDIAQLMPPPFNQLHSTWVQVRTTLCGSTYCTSAQAGLHVEAARLLRWHVCLLCMQECRILSGLKLCVDHLMLPGGRAKRSVLVLACYGHG
jgi:hypothetical protein